MKKLFVLSITLFFCSRLFSQSKESTIISEIDEYIAPYVKTQNFSGNVLVSYKNKILYNKSFGYASVELKVPNSRFTKFNIASISKMYTATAILLLQQDGLLNTTDYVGKFYPSLSYGDLVTVHQLLTHTSGVPNINNLPGYDSLAHFPQTPETLVNFIKDLPLEFDPGTRYRYSNSNFNLLALIIEKVSGLSYGAFLQKRIFEPLKLKNTGNHNNANEIIPSLANGYSSDNNYGIEKSPYLNWTSKTGNGSIFTTAEDLLKFKKALDTTIILKSSSLKLMFSNHYQNAGYGLFISPHLSKKRYYMNGRSPGVSSYFAEYPDDKLIIVVLGNNYIPLATQIGTDIASIIFNMAFVKPSIKYTTDNKTALDIVGKYKFDEKYFIPNAEISVSFNNGRVSCNWGELLFVKDYSFILRSFWSEIDFVKDKSGKITGLKSGIYSAKKIQE